MARNKLLFSDSSWDFNTIRRITEVVEKIGREDFNLDFYPNQIEIVSAENMIDSYTSHGMPIMYNHWSFGKRFLRDDAMYRKGRMNLAYEIVTNCNPCISYIMEENTATMQALVIAHAACGHNHFFKNNYLFKQWTDASAIIDYLVFAKNYIARCEERYGEAEVERILDACHTLQYYGVDRYKRPKKMSLTKETEYQQNREEEIQRSLNDLWRTLPLSIEKQEEKETHFPESPQENILYFVEKNSPILKQWERELVRIVRKVATYFNPNIQTRTANEGTATFYHYEIMTRLHDQGYINAGSYLEFLASHTSVIAQPDFDSKYFNGFNPYALGYNILRDVKRICENPTSEDKDWFPDIAGTDWKKTILDIVANYRDESLIRQFLSPEVIRKMHLFAIYDDTDEDFVEIDAIHNENGYRQIRSTLAEQYDPSNMFPNIQIVDVDVRGNRRMKLIHTMKNGVGMNSDTIKVLRHLAYLWGHEVELESFDPDLNKTVATWAAKCER